MRERSASIKNSSAKPRYSRNRLISNLWADQLEIMYSSDDPQMKQTAKPIHRWTLS